MSFENNANYIIHSVEIKGLWGKYNIKTNFDKDVNIFIGINGSYKTTFIKLIYNLLMLDFIKLIEVEFEYIKIELKHGKKIQNILFTKSFNDYKEKQYILEIENIDKICLSESDLKHYNKFFNGDDDIDETELDAEKFGITIKSKYSFMKKNISKLINIEFLNINRHHDKNEFYYPRYSNTSYYNTVDAELQTLIRQFIRYQNEIKTNINKCSNDFFKKAFESLLKKEIKIDKYDLKAMDDAENIINKISNDNIFADIDLTDANKLIKNTKKLVDKANKLNQDVDKQNLELTLDEMSNLGNKEFSELIRNLSQFSKFQTMFDLYKEYEDEKLKIEQPVKTFLEISNSFFKSSLFPNKKLIISDDGSLQLQIYDKNIIRMHKLSSGEKQLIILFLSTLLQKGKKGVYITDEPELSLHVSWQEKLINALKTINPNIQLIFATHSPDVVSAYEKNIKHMSEILSNE